MNLTDDQIKLAAADALDAGADRVQFRGWSRKLMAVDADGNSALETEKPAVSWCAVGAISEEIFTVEKAKSTLADLATANVDYSVYRTAVDALWKLVNSDVRHDTLNEATRSIAVWNDDLVKDEHEVADAMRQAAKNLREEAADAGTV